MAGSRQNSGRNKNLCVTYRCMGRKDKRICKNKDIRREYIEAFVLEKLSEYVFNDSLAGKIVKQAQQFLYSYNIEEIKKREAIKKRIGVLNKEIDNLVILAAKIGSKSIAEKIVSVKTEQKSGPKSAFSGSVF